MDAVTCEGAGSPRSRPFVSRPRNTATTASKKPMPVDAAHRLSESHYGDGAVDLDVCYADGQQFAHHRVSLASSQAD